MSDNKQQNEYSDITLKFILLGDTHVGKTSLLMTYTDNFFPDTHLSTIGIDFKQKIIDFSNLKIKLQIWDTAGQERFKSVTKNYFKGTQGVLFVYDITNK